MGEIFAHRYELLDPIAEGGMGSVWRVRDHQDGDIKAAKLLRHSDAGSLLRFMREQSTRIHHPNIVTPLSWVGEDDYMLFTMPLVRGGSVATLIGDWGALPEPWVRAILDQALSALAAVHAAGIVHRDLKPANLLLEPTGQAPPCVRLTDFGIAAGIGQPRLTSADVTLGTPGYMSPEQRMGAAPDPRQDLYGAATVGLEMLVGHPPPFAADDVPPTQLGAVLRAAADPDPRKRPGSAEELRAQVLSAVPPVWAAGEVEVLDHFAMPGASAPGGPAAGIDPATELMAAGSARGAAQGSSADTLASSEWSPAAGTAGLSDQAKLRLMLGVGVLLVVVSALLLLV